MICFVGDCPEVVASDQHEFCPRHWALLPWSVQVEICEAYGTPEWDTALARGAQTIQLLESQARKQRRGR